jgi:hypothetical protein
MISDQDQRHYLAIARRAAAEVIRTHKPGRPTEKGDRDAASEVDLAVERFVRDFLQNKAPKIGFLGEEEGGNSTGILGPHAAGGLDQLRAAFRSQQAAGTDQASRQQAVHHWWEQRIQRLAGFLDHHQAPPQLAAWLREQVDSVLLGYRDAAVEWAGPVTIAVAQLLLGDRPEGLPPAQLRAGQRACVAGPRLPRRIRDQRREHGSPPRLSPRPPGPCSRLDRGATRRVCSRAD